MGRTASGYSGRDHRGRHRSPNTPCHDCKAPMAWATAAGGYRIALDAERADVAGATAWVLLERRQGDWRLAFPIASDELVEEAEALGLDVRTSHFDTCPNRLERRRPPERKDLE